jgi:hypothetical protein
LPVVLLTGLLVIIGLTFGVLPALLLPALAFYAGWVGLMGVISARLLEQRGNAWESFRGTLRREGSKAALLGLFLHGVAYGYLTTAGAFLANRGDLAWLLLWLIESMIVIPLALAAMYAFPLLALHGKDLRSTLHDGLLLAVFAPWPAIAMLTFVILMVALATWIGVGVWLAAPPIAAALLTSNALLQTHLKTNFASAARPTSKRTPNYPPKIEARKVEEP